MKRFIHIADLHAASEKLEKFEESMNQLINYTLHHAVEAIFIAGDVFDSKQSFAGNSGVPSVLYDLKELSENVQYIFITKGNNAHDNPGSISLLHQLEPNIYAYEYPVVLGIYKQAPEGFEFENVVDILRNEVPGKADYIISLVPYPTKAMFVSEDSIDNNNAEFIVRFEQVFELIGDVTKEYDCPKFLAFHGNVVGSRLNSGQTLVSQDIMVAPSTLQKAKADYYALGHIHLRQEILPNMLYSGPIYNKNWGEIEQTSFEVIEVENGVITHHPEMFISSRPMIAITANFKDGHFVFGENITPNLSNQYRLKISVPENERTLITDDKINELKQKYGEDARIDLTVIPIERESRSETIMTCTSLADEVKEYASTIGVNLETTVFEKLNLLQEAAE